MRRSTAIGIGIIVGFGVLPAERADAQMPAPERLLARASLAAGHVDGLVRERSGRSVADASIVAVGQTIVAARSDARGRFSLVLPPGEYVLKASRAGYVSTYREPVHIFTATRLERTITLTPEVTGLETMADDGDVHTDLAWRLRHLARSVLRDGAATRPGASGAGGGGPHETPRAGLTPGADVASPFAALLAGADFRGQVNFITTSNARPLTEWARDPWPRGVTQVALGSPIAGHGAWQVRAAVASGDGSSWNLLGEYQSSRRDPHVWQLRVSYAAQGFTGVVDQLSPAVAEARTAAGVGGEDLWHVHPRVALDYGLQVNRIDYLSDRYLFSAHAGVTARVAPNLFVRSRVSRTMSAPGVDEFLPPAGGGPWLPAEQMFAPLSGVGALRAETVDRVEAGLARQFGAGPSAPIVHVRRFWERATDQMAAIFNPDARARGGQYAVAAVGAVDVAGWGIGVSGQFTVWLRGQAEYAHVTAGWAAAPSFSRLNAAAPSTLRGPSEHLQDLTASIDAAIARTATHVSVIYRASNAYSVSDAGAMPLPGSRFDLKVRQTLPWQPTRNGRLELLFAVRNLFRDARSDASWYDELLAVAPPVRVLGGIQIRF